MSKSKMMLAALFAATLSLTSCGISVNIGTSDSESESVTEAVTEEATEEATEEETEEPTEEETEPETEPETEGEEESAAEFEIAIDEDFTPVEGLSENYADLDNRSFAYDGKIFTLGKSTLQDLVDGGIPFKEDELNNIGNNVNKNYETSRYTVKINDYVSMQFVFMNDTDSNITEAECLLSTVRWYTLYVPQPDFDDSRNEEIKNNISDASTHVGFAFPLTLTKEQLLENNSDITSENEYGQVTYKIESEKYFGSRGYTFEFNDKTNQLKEVNISWLP